MSKMVQSSTARAAAPIGHPRTDIVVTEDHYAAFWDVRSRYMATEGDYDLDCTYGQGRTPLDAIVDLLDRIEE